MPDIAFLPVRANNSDDPNSPLEDFLIAARGEGNEDWIWSCKKTAAPGDLYLFWFGEPISTIAGIGICNSDVHEINNEAVDWTESPKLWMCSFDPLKELKHPVTSDHIKADGVLAEWWKGRPYRGRPKSITREAAASLLTLILRLNPNLDTLLRGYVTTSPVSTETIPDDGVGQATRQPLLLPEDYSPGPGGGFGSPESNKKIEQAAVKMVTTHYRKRGWLVRSVEQERIGFDLLCRKNSKEEHVEVKGVSGAEPHSFVLTAGEAKRAETDPAFVLCVVTTPLSVPSLHWFRQSAVLREFELVPVQYMARRRK